MNGQKISRDPRIITADPNLKNTRTDFPKFLAFQLSLAPHTAIRKLISDWEMLQALDCHSYFLTSLKRFADLFNIILNLFREN